HDKTAEDEEIFDAGMAAAKREIERKRAEVPEATFAYVIESHKQRGKTSPNLESYEAAVMGNASVGLHRYLILLAYRLAAPEWHRLPSTLGAHWGDGIDCAELGDAGPSTCPASSRKVAAQAGRSLVERTVLRGLQLLFGL